MDMMAYILFVLGITSSLRLGQHYIVEYLYSNSDPGAVTVIATVSVDDF